VSRDPGPRLAAGLLAAAALSLGWTMPVADDDAPTEAVAAESMAAQDLGGGLRPPPSSWVRVLDENFTGSTVDPHRWGRCHWWARGGCTIASNEELEWYRPENVTVSGGRLRLEAREGPYTNTAGDTFDYTSGMISTGPLRYRQRARRSFTYGYVEARLRLPAEQGLWPAFWMLPADSTSRPEIDILETLGQTPRIARFHLHYDGSGGVERSLGGAWSSARLADGGWHRFAVDWRPGQITWIVDGRARWRVTGTAVPSDPHYLVLNLAVGGLYPGPPDETTDLPAAVEADWIRVWRPPGPK
jgi:beta-glucanase (GH16 family)